jgi:hypothetical protein
MKLTLEQLALWLSTTHEPDLGMFTPDQRAALISGFSEEALAASGCTRGQARKGFIQAVNDRISQMEWWSEADRQKVDTLLSARSLPSLRAMEVIVKKKHKRILKRGAIVNDEEYYLVKELLSGPQSDISVDDLGALQSLTTEYESRSRK